MLELGEWDAVRVAPGGGTAMEAGPDGAEILAFGAPNTENKDAETSARLVAGGRLAAESSAASADSRSG